jgi:DNA polymerase III subunit delta
MQLNQQQFIQHLKGPLLPVYLLSGDTPLLRQEARDALRQAASNAGYTNHQRFTVDTGFHWVQLSYLASQSSLFADQTLLELYNPDAKFDVEAGKTLLDYCASPPADKILLIVSGKLTGAQQKTRWYQTLLNTGAILTIWPIKPHELPSWIQTRLRQAQMTADPAAIRLLAELTEGNLLATQQAIIKLRLLYPGQPIGVKEMTQAVSDNAQFNIFELSQYLLQGDGRGVLRVLHHLRSADTEPTLALWLLTRECRELLNMTEQLQQGKNVQAVLAAQWSSLKPLYQSALRRVNPAGLRRILLSCQAADQVIKGVALGDAWQAITRIALELAGIEC